MHYKINNKLILKKYYCFIFLFSIRNFFNILNIRKKLKKSYIDKNLFILIELNCFNIFYFFKFIINNFILYLMFFKKHLFFFVFFPTKRFQIQTFFLYFIFFICYNYLLLKKINIELFKTYLNKKIYLLIKNRILFLKKFIKIKK